MSSELNRRNIEAIAERCADLDKRLRDQEVFLRGIHGALSDLRSRLLVMERDFVLRRHGGHGPTAKEE